MKLIVHTVAVLFLSTHLLPAPVYEQHVIGYWNQVFYVGDNLFANPLEESTNNLLSGMFHGNSIPEGATVSFWNPASASFDTTSVYHSGAWSVDLTLMPGVGACLNTPTAFTNTYVGVVLNHDGSYYSGEPLVLPPVFAGPAGVYLFGDAAPVINTGTNAFINVLGRLPAVGEQVTLLNAATQTYTTSTYLGDNNWDVIPTLGISQAAFFNITTVPEPASATLGLLGIALLGLRARRR